MWSMLKMLTRRNVLFKKSVMRRLQFLIAVIGLNSVNVFASDIQFLTHSSEEQTYLDERGELRGKRYSNGKRAFYVEVIREMMSDMKHSKKITQVPFKRGFKAAQKQTNIALFNVSKTSSREHMFKWVGPLLKETDYFYEMQDNPTEIKTLEDARGVKSICVLNGGIHESILKNNNFKNIYTNKNYVNCFKMLILGRASLIPASSVKMKQLEQEGMPISGIQKIIKTPVILLESRGYIAFSKSISDETIKKWQRSLDRIKKSGKYQHLYNKFVEIDELQQVRAVE